MLTIRHPLDFRRVSVADNGMILQDALKLTDLIRRELQTCGADVFVETR